MLRGVSGSLPAPRQVAEVFSGESVAAIVGRLVDRAALGAEWAQEAVRMVQAASPTAVYLTLRLLRVGGRLGSLRECLQVEWHMACHCLMHPASDFLEGVAAALLRCEGWQPCRARLQRPTTPTLAHNAALSKPLLVLASPQKGQGPSMED